jgi:Protein of unknown function (DUF3147)
VGRGRPFSPLDRARRGAIGWRPAEANFRRGGLFSAAPAVAIVGLAILVLDKGAHQAHEGATGMIAGSAGMIAYASVVVPLLKRLRAAKAVVASLGAWLIVAQRKQDLPLPVGRDARACSPPTAPTDFTHHPRLAHAGLRRTESVRLAKTQVGARYADVT